jgi:pimeloyl-ACP methyl ester carboxylesterase
MMMPLSQVESDLNATVHSAEGPWLTLVHGGLANSATWGLPIRDLATDFRVLTYDLRGYGVNRAETPQQRDDVQDLLGLWAALDVSRSWLVGF